MQIRFLLGPAGSGKTFRCLKEIRDALHESPDGLPLVLLAPKQATFQLERQLLAEPAPAGLSGYTRLQILSFERLAHFIFDQLGLPGPDLLSEEGRVMVLRALLERKRGELRLFRASARLPGFARQLSQLLRELQHYRLNPARLEALAERVGHTGQLEAKLRDLALITSAYADWLKEHRLEDGGRLLDLATEEVLKTVSSGKGGREESSPLRLGGLWLDGFAQMTPQERRLLSAVIACSKQATLAFCLDGRSKDDGASWNSIWAPVAETFQRCRGELELLPGAEVTIETLDRVPEKSRFQKQPMLQQLERNWGGMSLGSVDRAMAETARSPIRLVACSGPEAEVEFAAREIRRYVREERGRFRDVAVLLRSLDPYHNSVRRIFTRYEIPFFLDRRESVAHHPLAELTRYALRLAAHGWDHDDWFGALKTGLVHDDESAIDRLENEALARGWRGRNVWLEPIQLPATSEYTDEQLEQLRQQLVPPFRQFVESLTAAQKNPTGAQLSAAFRSLWKVLKVDQKLEGWSDALARHPNQPAIHETVWDQMLQWLENLERAFAVESLPVNEWLTIIEAGLSNLSVGAIPPALDQVLVGAIDRSRNPDLQLALVLGANEGIFPAPPPSPVLLNRVDREMLASQDAPLGPGQLQQISLERYFGYIACTRARRGLALTWASRDREGRELQPSAFINDIRHLFGDMQVEEFGGSIDPAGAEHWSEIVTPILQRPQLKTGTQLPALPPQIAAVVSEWNSLAVTSRNANLPAELVERIYGSELRTSVSGLEDFAACPFKFFVGRGLRAEERMEFEIDPREKGSFQHDVLKDFHMHLRQEGKHWRDLTPVEARQLIRQVGEDLLPEFREGLFAVDPSRRFTAEMLIEGLERLMETLIGWTRQYQFDPIAVETGFGLSETSLPAWRIDLDEQHALLLRGRIDRIDVHRIAETGDSLGVVIDYKSSARQLDPVLLHHGLELQLLAYLGALAQFRTFDAASGLARIIPAGAFYVALKGGGGSAKTRQEELAGRDDQRKTDFQHRGRFDGGQLDKFDRNAGRKGDQFRYARNKDDAFSSRGNEALPTKDFAALITQVEGFLRQHGRDIYAGKVNIAPYRWKKETACEYCLYRSICRFDPWTQPYRVLRPPAK